MPLWSNTDNYNSKPLFPKERFQHGVVVISANATLTAQTVIPLPQGSTVNVSNGMIVTVFANTAATNVSSAAIGKLNFNVLNAPTVTNKTSNSVTISSATNGPIAAGVRLAFTKPIANMHSANANSQSYNANTILVTTTRLAKANHNANVQVAHVGWNHFKVGYGRRAGRVQSECLVALSNPNALDANSGNNQYYNYYFSR